MGDVDRRTNPTTGQVRNGNPTFGSVTCVVNPDRLPEIIGIESNEQCRGFPDGTVGVPGFPRHLETYVSKVMDGQENYASALGCSRPDSIANCVSSARLFIPSFVNKRARYDSTVLTLKISRSAIA